MTEWQMSGVGVRRPERHTPVLNTFPGDGSATGSAANRTHHPFPDVLSANGARAHGSGFMIGDGFGRIIAKTVHDHEVRLPEACCGAAGAEL